MDWVLVNPHPPAFNKNEFKDVMHLNSAEIPGAKVMTLRLFAVILMI